MATQAIISLAAALLFVSALFFIPKWLFWITPYASSLYDVLLGQYGRRTALWIWAVMTIVIAVGFFLLQQSTQ